MYGAIDRYADLPTPGQGEGEGGTRRTLEARNWELEGQQQNAADRDRAALPQ